MKTNARLAWQESGFTLVEGILTTGVVVVAGVTVAMLLSGSSLLFAKNISTNLTHNSVRSSMDKIGQNICQGFSDDVKLITPNGTEVTSGSAAGVAVDRFVGGPYVVTHPGGTGLSAGATTLKITRSTSASISAPLPTSGDVLILDGASKVRLKVASAVRNGGESTGTLEVDDVTLAAAAGAAIPWQVARTKLAHLIRREAFVVVPVGDRNELRYFNTAEGVTNFAAVMPSSYSLVARNVGVDNGDATPFELSTVEGTSLLKVVLRMRSDAYGNRLASGKEANKFSRVHRIEFLLNPRGR